MSILDVKNLTYIYSKKTPFEHRAIENVSFNVNQGEIVALIGHTGSGKSTLIQHLNGLFKADEGAVYFRGKDIWGDKKNIRNIRFKIGLCFQYPEYQLFEETVFADICYGPKNMNLSEQEVKERAVKAAKYMRIPKEYLNKSPFDLSGGEKRKVAMAGILAVEPEILVLDEPTAGLDPSGRDNLFSIIKEYRDKTDTTIVLVSHSMEDVAKIADRVIVMNSGTIAMNGTVDEVFSRADELVAMGLNVPMITRVFIALKKKGYDVSTSVYTADKAVEEINRLRGGLPR